MKIAIFLMDLRGGGAERVMVNLSQGFLALGHAVEMVLVKPEGPYLSELPPTLPVINLGQSKLLRALPGLVQYLRQNQPDILLTALEDTNIVALCARAIARVKTAVIVTVHTNLSKEMEFSTSFKRRHVPKLIPLFYPWADRVIGVSQGVVDQVIQLGSPARSTQVIYNPVVTPSLFVKAMESVQHRWLQPEATIPVIIGVGRLIPQKDFPTLIRAFAQVQAQRPARLMILGVGDELAMLQSLVQSLSLTDVVNFVGFVENPFAYMAKAAVCVLSSLGEGFGNVLVESMAVGVPVVSTDCPSGPAEILADGQFGPLVAMGDVAGMATAIASMLDQPPEATILRQRALDFSLDRVVNDYLQLFSTLCHQPPNLAAAVMTTEAMTTEAMTRMG